MMINDSLNKITPGTSNKKLNLHWTTHSSEPPASLDQYKEFFKSYERNLKKRVASELNIVSVPDLHFLPYQEKEGKSIHEILEVIEREASD